METPRTISRPIDLSAIDADGASYVLEPNDAERAAIARRLDVPAIDALRGAFFIRRVMGGFAIDLELDARTERTCVISLEPMSETIRETIRMQFDRNFVEDAQDAEDDDILHEPLDGDEIDLGELLVQHLSLALDPYPRKDGAVSLRTGESADASLSPFASLKVLKRDDQ